MICRHIYIYRERASTDIHSVMLNDITSKGTETFDGNEAPYTNCRLNLPQRKQRIADLLIYFQCRRIQALIYDIYYIRMSMWRLAEM